MAFQFPPSPSVGQTYTPSAGITFKWNGTAWYLVNSTLLTPAEADTRYVQIANARSMESRIINGSFAIDQRNAGAAKLINGAGIFGPDRWTAFAIGVGGGTFTLTRAGTRAMQAKVVTIDTQVIADDLHAFLQKIEGINIADFNLGTSGAQPFTFACQMYASVGGTYPIAFREPSGTASYIRPVTLAAATWTNVMFTVPGATVGTWNTTNGPGMEVAVSLSAGPDRNAPAANSWQNLAYFGVAGCVNMMATAGAEFWIADTRLYLGSIDYGPCQRLYADELRLCQRYYEKSYSQDVVPGTATNAGVRGRIATSTAVATNFVQVPLPVQMRTIPTVTLYSHVTGATGVWRTDVADIAAAPAFASDSHFIVQNTATATVGQGFVGHWTASAEL